jgi:hypothetical protein
MRPFTVSAIARKPSNLSSKGPFGLVEGFAPGGRDDRGDGHPVLIPALGQSGNPCTAGNAANACFPDGCGMVLWTRGCVLTPVETWKMLASLELIAVATMLALLFMAIAIWDPNR